jgi:hypothetical protein
MLSGHDEYVNGPLDMCGQAIDQNIFPKVLGTAQVLYCPKPTAEGNRTLELLPVPMEIFFGLLPWIRSLTVIHDVFQE